MSLIQTPWNSQPQQAVGIDWGNPITRGLVVAVSGANPRLNVAENRPVSFVGSPTNAITVDGVATRFTRASSQGLSIGTDARYNPAEITLLSVYTPTTVTSNEGQTLFSRDDNSLGRAFTLDLHGNAGYGARFYVAGGGSVGSNELRQGVTAVAGTRYVIAARQSGTASALFVNGSSVASSSSFTTKPSATGDTRIAIRTYSGSNEPANGTIPISLMWSRALTDAEIRSISQNPWQIFKPLPRRIFVPVAAGGGTTAVTADHNASYTITGSVAADASAAYAIRATVTADATASYSLRAAAQADQAAAYAIRAAVASDLAGSYAIQTAGTVTTGLDAAYAVRGSVAGDINVGYQIAAAVQAEVAAAYAVRAAVQKDLAAGYAIDAGVSSVAATLSAAYWIDGEAVILTPDAKFIARGAARNKTVTAAARRYQIATRSS